MFLRLQLLLGLLQKSSVFSLSQRLLLPIQRSLESLADFWIRLFCKSVLQVGNFTLQILVNEFVVLFEEVLVEVTGVTLETRVSGGFSGLGSEGNAFEARDGEAG